MTSNSRPRRPVLRYHGGKFKLRSWIAAHFPPHTTYVEPYGGAGSVLMFKPRTHAEMINDLDGEIVNLFRVLRDPVQASELGRLLSLTPYARSEYEAAYLPAADPVEQARRTMLKSFAGFGADAATATGTTGFRNSMTPKRGTTPAHDWANLPEAVAAFTARLRGVVIENRPALSLIKKHDALETLFYLDPTYPHSTRSGHAKRRHSYRYEMSDPDHRELSEVAHGAKAMIVISGYPCPMYDRELYADWHRFESEALADGGRTRIEVLWMNDAAYDVWQVQRSLFDAEYTK